MFQKFVLKLFAFVKILLKKGNEAPFFEMMPSLG